MKKSFLSVAAAALMFAACNEPLNDAAEVEMVSQEENRFVENIYYTSNATNGIIGVVEMWGPYFGEYKCFEKLYPNASSVFDPYENWFKPGVLQELETQAGLTPRQIYNALTPASVSHYTLKIQLITLYPFKKNAIEKCFKDYGF